MDRELTAPERHAYWQEDQEGRYALQSNGQERAVVDLGRQAVTVHYEDGFTADLKVPDYVCAFDEAERLLGLPRLDDVRGVDGSPDPDARKSAELEAALAGETRMPEQWTRAYAARAFHLLSLNGVDRELSDSENQAGSHLAAAVDTLDRSDPHTDVRKHLEAASGLLANGREDQRYGSPSLACDKALAVLDYEDARQAMFEASAEEALRRGRLELEQERSDSVGSDWMFQPSRSAREDAPLHEHDVNDDGRAL